MKIWHKGGIRIALQRLFWREQQGEESKSFIRSFRATVKTITIKNNIKITKTVIMIGF